MEEKSGKIIVRAPKTLHSMLAEKAKLENTSLNQLCLMYLSIGLGRDEKQNMEIVKGGKGNETNQN